VLRVITTAIDPCDLTSIPNYYIRLQT